MNKCTLSVNYTRFLCYLHRYFVPLPVFYTQSAVGRLHFITEYVCYTQSAFSQSMFYTQSVVRSPQSAVRSPCFILTVANLYILNLKWKKNRNKSASYSAEISDELKKTTIKVPYQYPTCKLIKL